MAKPIKDTPVIKGKDALRFRRNLAKTEDAKMPSSQMVAMKANYNKIMSVAVQAN